MGKRIYEKALRQRENNPENSLPHATAKYIRISPYKVRAVLDLIRGKSYRQAVGILENLNKSSCDPILKVLKSAGANAENNQGRSTDTLFVAKCYADQGPTLKRYIPKSHGRAGGLLKRTSHITIVLDEIKA